MPVASRGRVAGGCPASFWLVSAFGSDAFSFQPFADFLTEPGLQRSLWLSLSIAFVSTFLSYWLAIFLLALIYGQGQSGFFIPADITALTFCAAYHYRSRIFISASAQRLAIAGPRPG